MEIFDTFASIIEQPGIRIDDDAMEVLEKRLIDETVPFAFVNRKTDEEIDELEVTGDTYICDIAYRSGDDPVVSAVIFLWAASDLGFDEGRFLKMLKKYVGS